MFDFGKIGKIVKIANGITNPKQGVKMLLQEMSKKNPQKAKQLETLMSKGASASNTIVESAKNGEINMKQLNDLKQAYSFAKKCGLKINVPNKVFVEAEKAIKQGSNTNTQPVNNGGFGGF